MENVYEILNKKDLMYILSDQKENEIEMNDVLRDVAIIANLYYPDTLERYFTYFDQVPNGIFIYIFCSNSIAYESIESYIKRKDNRHIQLIKKENRGRDIGTLLVASRELMRRYKIVGFVHDKKVSIDYLKKDGEGWISNLWGNTLNSTGYIYNILALFETKKNIGMLVPPAPIGEYMGAWYENAWYNNYENTVRLADELNLNCVMDSGVSPITLGTVFWARTVALRKLFEKDWKYEDFDEEPLPYDGTISHAVERILAYVVQDAGYDTGIIMNVLYAEKLIMFLQRSMSKTFDILRDTLGIANIAAASSYESGKEYLLEFCRRNKEICIYGAGIRGKKCLNFLRIIGYTPTCFCVTKRNTNGNDVEGIPVMEIQDMVNLKSIGIIIAVNHSLQGEIINTLKELNFHNFIIYMPIEPSD